MTSGARVSVNADATVTRNLTIEERINVLEQNYANLREDLDRSAVELKRDMAETKMEIDKNLSHMNLKITDVESKVDDYAVGGMSLEIVGLGWLFFGIIFASIPDEIASVFLE